MAVIRFLRFRDLEIGAVFLMEHGGTDLRCVKLAHRKYRVITDQPTSTTVTAQSILTVVTQPSAAEPADYAPFDGLRVWHDEVIRLSAEIAIYYVVTRSLGDSSNPNYADRLRRERDIAAARLAAYAGQVLRCQEATPGGLADK